MEGERSSLRSAVVIPVIFDSIPLLFFNRYYIYGFLKIQLLSGTFNIILIQKKGYSSRRNALVLFLYPNIPIPMKKI
jgi:hypothetical protein